MNKRSIAMLLFLGAVILFGMDAFNLLPNITVAEMKESVLTPQAQGKPNFTGTWKLNTEASKTEQGDPMSNYKSFILTLDHKEPALSIKQVIVESGERTLIYSATTDGKEHPSKIYDQPAIAWAKWEGNSLTMYLKRDLPQSDGRQIETTRTVTLSPDGKTMTASVKVKQLPAGQYSIVGNEVWEKQ